jgi:hypothetical protein
MTSTLGAGRAIGALSRKGVNMSWDVSVVKCAVTPPPVSELPADFTTDSIGTADSVRAAITEVLPATKWRSTSWGVYDGEGFSLEFVMTSGAILSSFSIHVRGNGEPIAVLQNLASRNSWYMLDMQIPEWLHHSPDPSKSWHRFRESRDRANASRRAGEPEAG